MGLFHTSSQFVFGQNGQNGENYQQAVSRGFSTSDRFSYKELSKYRLKPPKRIVQGTPKKTQGKTTNFYVQEYRDITLNKKLGKIRT